MYWFEPDCCCSGPKNYWGIDVQVIEWQSGFRSLSSTKSECECWRWLIPSVSIPLSIVVVKSFCAYVVSKIFAIGFMTIVPTQFSTYVTAILNWQTHFAFHKRKSYLTAITASWHETNLMNFNRVLRKIVKWYDCQIKGIHRKGHVLWYKGLKLST